MLLHLHALVQPCNSADESNIALQHRDAWALHEYCKFKALIDLATLSFRLTAHLVSQADLAFAAGKI